MATVNTRNINLVDEVASRMKESSFGIFIKDEDLYSITEEAMERALFQDRVVKGEYGRTDTKEPLLIEMAREEYGKQLQKHVAAYIASKDDEIQAFIKEKLADTLDKLTPEYLVYTLLQGLLHGPVASFKIQVMQNFADILQNPNNPINPNNPSNPSHPSQRRY